MRLPHRSLRLLVALTTLCAAPSPSIAQFVGPQVSPDCHLTKVAQIPIERVDRHFVAIASVNGHPLHMVVDTGASKSALLFDVIDTLKLPHDRRQSITVSGLGGDLDAQNPAIVHSFKLGGLEWPDLIITGMGAVPGGVHTTPLGLIGADVLSGYDVEFDFPNGVMTLYSASGCSGAFVPWQGRYSTFPANRTSHRAFMIPVALNGHTVRAMLDTGSDATSMSLSTGLQVGVTPDAIEQDKAGTRGGARGVDMPSHLHKFETMAVGHMTFHGPQIAIIDEQWTEFDMLLGLDFMRWRKVWFSYATNQVFMQFTPPLNSVDGHGRPVAPLRLDGLATRPLMPPQ